MGKIEIDAAEYERLVRDSESLHIVLGFLKFGNKAFFDENIRIALCCAAGRGGLDGYEWQSLCGCGDTPDNRA